MLLPGPLGATQLDTSPGFCAELSTANCCVSAWDDSSPRCHKAFGNPALTVSRYIKIKPFVTCAEGRD